MREVYELDVYRLAEELSDIVWDAFDTWNEKARRTIGYQIIRSADSIAANLAEGYGRYSPKTKPISIVTPEAHLKKPNAGFARHLDGRLSQKRKPKPIKPSSMNLAQN